MERQDSGDLSQVTSCLFWIFPTTVSCPGEDPSVLGAPREEEIWELRERWWLTQRVYGYVGVS